MKKPFTLLEILVAMSILTVFLLGLMQFYSSTESILSAGIERTEMFERARIAMDMMANDLVCAYYTQSGKLKTKAIDVYPNKKGFKVASVRPEKLDGAKTCVVGAQYEWNSGKRTLDYTYDTKGDNFDISRGFKLASKETALVEGVNDFQVEAFAEGDNLPALIVIRMELVDARTMRRYKANPNAAILDSAPKREFRRMVIIDRGQPKPAVLETIFEEGGD